MSTSENELELEQLIQKNNSTQNDQIQNTDESPNSDRNATQTLTSNATTASTSSAFELEAKPPITDIEEATTLDQITQYVTLEMSNRSTDEAQPLHEHEMASNQSQKDWTDEDEEEKDRVDYVLVYSNKSKQKYPQIECYLDNLKANGLTLAERSYKDDMVFVLVRTPLEKLFDMAEKLKLKLPIQENVIRLHMIENNQLQDEGADKNENEMSTIQKCFEKLIDPFQLPVNLRTPKMRKYFTAPYSAMFNKNFAKYFNKNRNKIISNKDRILLTHSILSRTTYSKRLYEPRLLFSESNANAGIHRLISDEIFLAAYPLHESFAKKVTKENKHECSTRQILWDYWANPKQVFLYQPLHLVRDYFGEKLAFYFSWLGFYTTWLLLPSICGFLVFIYGYFTVGYDIPTNEICNAKHEIMCPLCESVNCESWRLADSCTYSKITYLVDNPGTIFFSIFMAVWTVLFIEFWKREQSKLQFDWDIIDFEKNIESTRPEFEAKVSKMPVKRKNPITGRMEPYVPVRKRIQKYAISFTAVLFMICLVLALVFGVIVYRIVLMIALSKRDETRKLSATITSVTAATINLVIILVLSRFYAWLAEKLTDMEYHRTDSQYEDSLTIKMYLFQFVNFYASVFYIAFLKGRFKTQLSESCDQAGCLIELCIQLAIIMVGKQILNNIQEVLYPIVFNCWNRGMRRKNSEQPRWRQDYNLLSWTSLTLFDEYLEMVIQFGFITLFVVAFPLGPLFAFLNNILEIRIDAFKVLTQLRRPRPKKAQNIGVWLSILNTISKLGVITNGLIIAFTSEFIPRMVYRMMYNDGSLAGYVNHTLSIKSVQDFAEKRNENFTHCKYRDFREPYDAPNKYEHTIEYYIVLVARLLFFVIFEHVVFSIVTLMHWIPDVPKITQDQIEAENLVTQRAFWEYKSDGFVHDHDDDDEENDHNNTITPTNNNNSNNSRNSRSSSRSSKRNSRNFVLSKLAKQAHSDSTKLTDRDKIHRVIN